MNSKIALITGSNRGLGRSMALHLAKVGVGIIGTYLAHREEAESFQEALAKLNVPAAFLPLDVTQSETFALFEEQLAEIGATNGLTRHIVVPDANGAERIAASDQSMNAVPLYLQ